MATSQRLGACPGHRIARSAFAVGANHFWFRILRIFCRPRWPSTRGGALHDSLGRLLGGWPLFPPPCPSSYRHVERGALCSFALRCATWVSRVCLILMYSSCARLGRRNSRATLYTFVFCSLELVWLGCAPRSGDVRRTHPRGSAKPISPAYHVHV